MKEVRIKDKLFREYLTQEKIREAVATLAAEISRDYKGKYPLILPVLNGAFIFAADLVRELSIESEVQFIKVSTYGQNMSSSGKVDDFFGKQIEMEGRHVLLLEDIVDSGITCQALMDHFGTQGPASLKMISLLFKPEAFKATYKPDYLGFSIPNRFVVGYGLDYAQKGRALSGIYALADEN